MTTEREDRFAEPTFEDGRPATRPPGSLHDLLFDRYVDAVLVTDADGRYVEANLSATELLGYARTELLGMHVSDIAADERSEAEFARFSGEGYWRGEVELRRKDGTTVRVEARASLVDTPDGRWGVAILRESAEPLAEALRATEAQLAAVVESSYDAIFSEDPDGTLRTWNKGAERVFGYTADEVIGRHVSILAPPERRTELEDNLERARHGERVREFETTRLRKDGARVEVSLSFSPIRDPQGMVTGISAIARDVSQRRVTEKRTQVLYQLTDAVGHARAEGDVYDAALDALQRAIHTDRASILLLDEEGVMRFEAWRGLSETYRQAVEGHMPWARDDPDPSTIHIPDVDADASLAELRTIVREEGIRALSFVPLAQHGELLGKFMLYFDLPRTLQRAELRLVEAIADQVAFALTRLRAERALEQARAQLELITIGSADGITIQAADGRVVYANLAAARLSGYDSVDEFIRDARRFAERWELFDEHGNPFEAEALPGRRALLGEPNPEAEVRVRDKQTGIEHWRRIRAAPAAGEDGRIRYAINLFHDITAERRAQEQLRFQAALLRAQAEASIEGILVVSTGGRMVSWNRRFTEMWGIPDDVMTARSDDLAIAAVVSQLVDPEGFRRRIEELYSDTTAEAADELELIDGRLFERHTKPLVDEAGTPRGRIWFFRDATQDRRREASQRLLADAGKVLAGSLDDARFDAVLEQVVAWKADGAVLYVDEGDAVRVIGIRHADAPGRMAIETDALRRFKLAAVAPHPDREILASGRPLLLKEITEGYLREVTGGGPLLDLLLHERFESAIVVPVRLRGEVVAALAVGLRGARTYDEDDVDTLERVGQRIALAFDSARLYRERDFIARTLQQSLLPSSIPEIPGLEVEARYRAAGEGIDVGGDFYDVFEMREGVWGIAVGDVCGKGPTAAALTGIARHTLRAGALLEDRPARVLSLVNEAILRGSPEDSFCTLAFGRLERSEDGFDLRMCLGGHPAPIVLHPDGSTEELHDPGSLLGMFPDPHLPETARTLRPGDALVLYSDGVTDEQRDGQEFGVQRLVNVVRDSAGGSAAEIASAIERAVDQFGRGPARDDIAVLVVRVVA